MMDACIVSILRRHPRLGVRDEFLVKIGHGQVADLLHDDRSIERIPATDLQYALPTGQHLRHEFVPRLGEQETPGILDPFAALEQPERNRAPLLGEINVRLVDRALRPARRHRGVSAPRISTVIQAAYRGPARSESLKMAASSGVYQYRVGAWKCRQIGI